MALVLIPGAGGRLGAALAQVWSSPPLSHNILPLSRAELDVADNAALERFLESLPTAAADGDIFLFNCTGLTSLEKCEENPAAARAINCEAVGRMAAASRSKGIRFVHFSTDYVFDGNAREPYPEDAPALPLGEYGRSKLAGEEAAMHENPGSWVFRVSWVFGPHRAAFPDMMIQRALETDRVSAVSDKWASPTFTLDIASALAPLFSEGPPPPGVYHFCNSGLCTWVEYATHALECAKRAGLPVKTTTPEPVSLSSFPSLSAPRPVFSALSTAKFAREFGITPRGWREALADHITRFAPDCKTS